jgi:hypothetical protein
MSMFMRETICRRRVLVVPGILLRCPCRMRLDGKAQISGYKDVAQYVRLSGHQAGTARGHEAKREIPRLVQQDEQ